MKKLKSGLKPEGIQREKVLYHDNFIVDDFASATAIRKMIVNRQFNDIMKVMPRSAYILLAQDFDLIIFTKSIILLQESAALLMAFSNLLTFLFLILLRMLNLQRYEKQAKKPGTGDWKIVRCILRWNHVRCVQGQLYSQG